MVKMTATPTGKPDPQSPPIAMELTAKGTDAKPLITKAPKPFDPSEFGGSGGHPPAGGPPPSGQAPAPRNAPPPAKAPVPKP
jgi:hypothetical protein